MDHHFISAASYELMPPLSRQYSSTSPLLELNFYCLDIFLQLSGTLKRDFFGGDCNSSPGFWGRINILMYLWIHTPSVPDSLSLASGLFLILCNSGSPSRSLTLETLFTQVASVLTVSFKWSSKTHLPRGLPFSGACKTSSFEIFLNISIPLYCLRFTWKLNI